MASTAQPGRSERLAQRLDRSLDKIEAARPLTKSLYQSEIFEIALRLLKEPEGPETMYRRASRFEAAGVFHGGDWNDPATLQPGYVEAALTGHPFSVAVESLNQLRLLAVAEGKVENPSIEPSQARKLLEQVLALNLRFLFPDGAYSHEGSNDLQEGVGRLVRFLADGVGVNGILDAIVSEAGRILAQRPIVVVRVRAMIEMAAEHVAAVDPDYVSAEARLLIEAARGPTELSREAADPDSYRKALEGLTDAEMDAELEALARTMRQVNLVSAQHAVALHYVASTMPDKIPRALGLDGVGEQSFAAYDKLIQSLIDIAVHPQIPQTVIGLACLLERGTLFFPPIAPSLWRLIDLELPPEVEKALDGALHMPELSAHAELVSGTIRLLGQPLGIGQGNNPTCQSARAISLWAQCDPGYLLELIVRASVDDEIELHFEGQSIGSNSLAEGMASSLHSELDPVSLLLVPHLDRIYGEMSRRVAGRGIDGHKWINPEFHGFWVHRGFATPIELTTQVMVGFDEFIRLFYAAYHPFYNGGRWMIYPQPAGVAATNIRGDFLGWHAVAIQRVALDESGEMRVYLFDPNEEGRQNWGQGIETSTSGRGEFAGESSLPFDEFASRLYVFHYNEREVGELGRVPAEIVAKVVELVRQSWARKFLWQDESIGPSV